jgi:hypothetical protein
MKTLKLASSFIFLMLAFSMFGCKDDSSSDKSLKEQLIGKWEQKSEQYISYEDNVKTGEESYTYEAEEFQVEILSDGTGKIYEYGDMTETFTWTLSGTTLTINSGGDIMEVEVTLSGNDLTLKQTDSEMVDGTTYKYEYIIKMKRI